MSIPTFSDTHNMVAFLEKPAESDGFHEIIDFLNSNQIHYALTVNPTIYTPCIEQFWATTKIKTVNGERQLQALVDKKKVIIMETSIRSDLHLEDAGGLDCLPTATIFEELEKMGYVKPSQKLTFYKDLFSPQWKFLIHTITQCLSAKTTTWNEFSSTMASAIICLATNQKFNLSKYIFDAMVKHLEGGVKFLMYPRFVQVFINQQLGDMSHHKNIYVNPSHIKKIFANMKREGKYFSGRVTPLFATMMIQANQEEGVDSVPHPSDSTADIPNEESVPTHSNYPLLSGEDRLKLTELMDMCTKLTERVLDLEHTKTTQAQKITNLKLKVKKLEKKAGLKTHKFKRLYKGRSIEDIDKDAEVSLVDETQGRKDDEKMFDTDALFEVSTAAPSTTAVPPPSHVITEVEITLAQTLAKLKSEKSKVMIQEPVQNTTITAPSTIPKAKGITFRDVDERTTRTLTSVSSLSINDKEKDKMDEPEEEEANIALIESWDNTQAMMEEDFKLAQRLQAEEQGEITIEERSRLFVELMNKRKKHFAMLRGEEKRRKTPTKAQKRNLMSTYLKNMDGYKYNQLKSKSYDEI
ncbi:hypothetical protein Tco_1571498 [Tanacetum coccineum]